MPYINPEKRSQVNSAINHLLRNIQSAVEKESDLDGVLNYTITQLVVKGFKPKNGWKYSAFCRVTGCLTNVLQEIYRRLISPYEDKAKEKNGDLSCFDIYK